jgi:hypothetical protein
VVRLPDHLANLEHFGEGDNYRVVIVGTHLDEADKRQVSIEKADALAAKIDGIYMEVSNKTGENTSLPFLTLASQCWRSSNLRDYLLQRPSDWGSAGSGESKPQTKQSDKKCLLQ